MVKTIEQLLERGEKLDTLVDKCNDMSLQCACGELSYILFFLK
jgi:hypothetical protein